MGIAMYKCIGKYVERDENGVVYTVRIMQEKHAYGYRVKEVREIEHHQMSIFDA